MIPIYDHLVNVFSVAISSTYPTLTNIKTVIAVGTNAKFGDYQCNSAIQISMLLKNNGKISFFFFFLFKNLISLFCVQTGIKEPPRDVAAKILKNIPQSPLIDKCDVAGAGFINIYLSRVYGAAAIKSVLVDGVKPPQTDRKRVVVDFSAPNIAKEMHVGHLRSTIIGESICRMLEFLGHDVLRLNHIGDWGTQFGMLIAHLEDRFPDYDTVSPPISDLQTFYKQSKARFDEDAEFKKRAYDRVVKLQSGDPKCTRAWTLICDVSRKDFQRIYDRLEVHAEERGESFYQSRMIKVIDELKQKNLLIVEEGRTIMWGHTEKVGIPLTIIKSDGGFTYDTSDMATIKNRIQEEKGDWLIYITDAGQVNL